MKATRISAKVMEVVGLTADSKTEALKKKLQKLCIKHLQESLDKSKTKTGVFVGGTFQNPFLVQFISKVAKKNKIKNYGESGNEAGLAFDERNGETVLNPGWLKAILDGLSGYSYTKINSKNKNYERICKSIKVNPESGFSFIIIYKTKEKKNIDSLKFARVNFSVEEEVSLEAGSPKLPKELLEALKKYKFKKDTEIDEEDGVIYYKVDGKKILKSFLTDLKPFIKNIKGKLRKGDEDDSEYLGTGVDVYYVLDTPSSTIYFSDSEEFEGKDLFILIESH